jgi:hypothetical protein
LEFQANSCVVHLVEVLAEKDSDVVESRLVAPAYAKVDEDTDVSVIQEYTSLFSESLVRGFLQYLSAPVQQK